MTGTFNEEGVRKDVSLFEAVFTYDHDYHNLLKVLHFCMFAWRLLPNPTMAMMTDAYVQGTNSNCF